MSVEVIGDRWSLVVLRDVMFGGRTRFRDIEKHSLEGIASNVLASRLKKLTEAGLLSRRPHPKHRQGFDYFLTEPSIQLVPVIVELGAWGSEWLPTAPELAERARMLAAGERDLLVRFMDELRSIHIDHCSPPEDGVLASLHALSSNAST